MKRSATYLLLIILLFNTTGIYLLYTAGESILEKKAQKKISMLASEDLLIKFRMTSELASQITWKKPAKEFSYKGTLYDVVKKEYDNEGKAIYTCYADHEETSFVTYIEKAIGKAAKNKGTGSTAQLLSKLITTFFILPESPVIITTVVSEKHNTAHKVSFPCPPLGVPTQPPRTI